MIKLLSILAVISGLTWAGLNKEKTVSSKETIAESNIPEEEVLSIAEAIKENIAQEEPNPKTEVIQKSIKKEKKIPPLEISAKNAKEEESIIIPKSPENTITTEKTDSNTQKKGKNKIIAYSQQGPTVPTNIWKQVRDKVNISVTYDKISNTTYELKYTFKMKKGWGIYYKGEEGGPIYMAFNYSKLKNAKFLTSEPTFAVEPKTVYDPMFGMNIQTIKGKEVLTHKFEVINSKIPIKIKGAVEYMMGNHERCHPPLAYAFEFKIK